MPKLSFRMASASCESVFRVQTNTARKIHRSDHTEGPLTTAPNGCCVRKGTAGGTNPGLLGPRAKIVLIGTCGSHRGSRLPDDSRRGRPWGMLVLAASSQPVPDVADERDRGFDLHLAVGEALHIDA